MRVLQGHSGSVRCLAYSPDGRLLASGSEDGTVLLWDLGSGQSRVLAAGNDKPHQDWVQALAFSPDGVQLVSGSWDGKSCLWRFSRGTPRRVPCRPNTGIWCLAFSPDGLAVVAGTMDGKIFRGWTRQAVVFSLSWDAHQAPVRALFYTPDNRTLISASHDRTIKLWDADWVHVPPETLGEHPDWICCLALSPNGRLLASAGDDGPIRLWDLGRREQISLLAGHEKRVCQLAFTQNERFLVSGSWDGTIRYWDLAARRVCRTLDFQLGPVHCVALAPDGMTAAVGGREHDIVLWDLDDLD